MKTSKKTKLLIITDYFYPHWTGISKSIYNLIRSLENQFDMTVLTIQHQPTLKKTETLFSANIIRENYLFSLSRGKYSIQLIVKFLSLIKNHDVVLINSPNAHMMSLSFITKLFGKKLLIFHQGDLILPKGFINRIIEKIFDISSSISFSLADSVSTYTRDYAEHSRALTPFLEKFCPVLMPIYLKEHVESADKKFKKIRELKKKGRLIFGSAGRFVEEKGFDILFDAIPMVLQKMPNAHFVFAGETKIPYENFYTKNLSKLKKIKRRVTFLGLLHDADLMYFYKNISFIIVPSRSDCFPLVQAEAVLSKTPSIVSDIPGARVIVKKTGFGFIFEKENAEDLAAKIIESTKYRKECLKHYKSVLELLNNKKNVEKIREFIEG